MKVKELIEKLKDLEPELELDAVPIVIIDDEMVVYKGLTVYKGLPKPEKDYVEFPIHVTRSPCI